jgi:hypothetical protein
MQVNYTLRVGENSAEGSATTYSYDDVPQETLVKLMNDIMKTAYQAGFEKGADDMATNLGYAVAKDLKGLGVKAVFKTDKD